MTADICRAFMGAIEAAEVKSYQFNTDLGTRLYHDGERAIAKPNYSIDAIVALRSGNFAGSHNRYQNKINVVVSDFGDIHEVEAGLSVEQAKKFCEAMDGFELTDDDLKILLNIDGANYNINPVTGDYVNAFHYLSKKQLEELTPEERAEYEAKLAEYEEKKSKYLGSHQAAQITL